MQNGGTKIIFGLKFFWISRRLFPLKELLPAEDTNTVESICKILRTFYQAVEVTYGTVCPTANMYFNELWMVRATLEEQASTDYTELSSMVWEMQKAFDEFWQNSYVWLSVPVVFDPRFKIAFVDFRLKQAFGSKAAKYVSAISCTIHEFFLEYCSSLSKPSVNTSNCETPDVQVGGFYSYSLEDWDEHINAQIRSQVSTELTNYLDDGLVPRDDDFDILNWWMNNAIKYPILSVMARDILAMPGSAVQCEAALSSEGPVINKQWSKLNINAI